MPQALICQPGNGESKNLRIVSHLCLRAYSFITLATHDIFLSSAASLHRIHPAILRSVYCTSESKPLNTASQQPPPVSCGATVRGMQV